MSSSYCEIQEERVAEHLFRQPEYPTLLLHNYSGEREPIILHNWFLSMWAIGTVHHEDVLMPASKMKSFASERCNQSFPRKKKITVICTGKTFLRAPSIAKEITSKNHFIWGGGAAGGTDIALSSSYGLGRASIKSSPKSFWKSEHGNRSQLRNQNI